MKSMYLVGQYTTNIFDEYKPSKQIFTRQR